METEFARSYPTVGGEITGATAVADGPDRRRSPRHRYEATAWLSPEAENPSSKQRQVVVTDLSMTGVGFTTSTQPEVGAIHWIVIGAGALRASSRLRIVSCRPADTGGWEIGGEFF